ncbi:MAG: hypothetical protein IJJ70_09540 [Treponema sp.]|nr:hypothetical protein [Treponema sp.]
MKKLIAALTVLFASVFCFANDYLNFTIPLDWGFYFQDKKNSTNLDTYEYIWSYGVTAEYFHTFSGPFGLGVKGGVKKCDVHFEVGDNLDYDANSIGWSIAPSLGWAFDGSSTKKKINIYPLIFERFNLTDIDGVDDDKFVLTNYKLGVTFSWQWGDDIVSNGVEFGFSLPWEGYVEYDGTKVSKNGTGFDFHIAYKLSVCMTN